MKKVFFIINKFAGTGFQPEIEGRIIDTCAALQLECSIEYTLHKGHAITLARQASEAGFDRVFALGGDGTVNEVAQGLVHTATPMGILPKGSGNGLARHLGIPLKISSALGLLHHSDVIDIDTIRVNERLSVNVSGIGFDAHIAAQFAHHTRRGLMGYARIVLREFAAYPEFRGHIKIDNRELDDPCFLLAIANSSQFGNNAAVSPHASVCDQLIDICLVRKVPLTRAPAFAAKMFTGRAHQSQFVTIHQSRRLTADFPEALPFHVDGEPCPPSKHFEVTIDPHSLKMIVPKGVRP